MDLVCGPRFLIPVVLALPCCWRSSSPLLRRAAKNSHLCRCRILCVSLSESQIHGILSSPVSPLDLWILSHFVSCSLLCLFLLCITCYRVVFFSSLFSALCFLNLDFSFWQENAEKTGGGGGGAISESIWKHLFLHVSFARLVSSIITLSGRSASFLRLVSDFLICFWCWERGLLLLLLHYFGILLTRKNLNLHSFSHIVYGSQKLELWKVFCLKTVDC